MIEPDIREEIVETWTDLVEAALVSAGWRCTCPLTGGVDMRCPLHGTAKGA